jgi:hypothetical protein
VLGRPKCTKKFTALLLLFLTLLIAPVPDKSGAYILAKGGGSGFPSFGGSLDLGGLPGPGGLPTFGASDGIPISGDRSSLPNLSRNLGSSDVDEHKNTNPNSVSPNTIKTNNLLPSDHPSHSNTNNKNMNLKLSDNNNVRQNDKNPNNLPRNDNAPVANHCTGYGPSTDLCRPVETRDGNLSPAQRHCTGYGISANPCNNKIDPCLINPCPLSPCVINPCEVPYDRLIVGGEDTISSSSMTVNNQQSSDSNNNNNDQQQESTQNTIPVADAGPNKNVHSSNHVTLDGSNSYDPNGKKLAYSWIQLAGGPIVALSNDHGANPTFKTPNINATSNLTFQLIVNNGYANSNPSYVTITVEP